MILRYLHIVLIILFLAGCTPIEQDEEVLPPEVVNLVFPEDNTECNTGTTINETQSTVAFEWNASENTDVYEVFVTELNTDEIIQIDAMTNGADITIKKATAYEWYVVSKSNATDETATSDTWQFYNAGDAVTNYAPFPADLNAPTMGSSLSEVSTVSLQWVGHDVDSDIVQYEVYFDTNNPPALSLGTVSDSNLTVDVTSGTIYYWSVKTTDSAENTSESDIFWFSVN